MEPELRSKIKVGLQWSLWGRGLKVFIDLGISLLLMRLIAPTYHGQFAMVAVIAGFLEMFRAWGTTSSIIQQDEVKQEDLSTLFWFNVFTGIAAAGVLLLLNSLLAKFYQSGDLWPIVVAYALNLVLSGSLAIPLAYWLRSFDYQKLFWVELIPGILAGIGALFFALHQAPQLALFIRMLLPSVIILGIVLLSLGHQLGSFKAECLKRHIGFGWPIATDELLNYIVRNVDNMLIGHVLGANALGLYSRAYSLLLFPLRNFSQVVAKALFPVLGTLREQPEQVLAIYLKVVRLIACLLFPFLTFVYFFAEPLVNTILGASWAGSIPLIKVFAMLGLAQSVGTLEGLFFQSMGVPRQQLRIGLVTKPILVGAMVAGLFGWQSSVGLATAYALASTGVVLYGARQLLRLLERDFVLFFRQLWPPLLLCGLAGLLSKFLAGLVLFEGRPFFYLGLSTLSFSFVYLAGLVYLFPKVYEEAKVSVRSIVGL